jgi:hypothetical protein
MKALRILKNCRAILPALLLIAVTTQLHAQSQPAYLHAIRDLREARAILSTGLNDPVHIQAAQAANVEIDNAINGLKRVAALDGQSLGDVPTPKAVPPAARFQQAIGFLNEASTDISAPNPDPAVTAHVQHALEHIQKAEAIINKAQQQP